MTRTSQKCLSYLLSCIPVDASRDNVEDLFDPRLISHNRDSSLS